MPRTYEVWLTDLEGVEHFQPLLAESEAELLAKVRALLAAGAWASARAALQDRPLFEIAR